MKIYFIFFLLIGVAISSSGLSIIIKNYDSLYWNSVKGTILSAEIYTDTVSGSLKDSSGMYLVGATTESSILYEYEVGGVSYLGNRVAVAEVEGSHNNMDLMLAYKKDLVVDVYYNKNDPKESVLVPGDSSALIGGGVNFFIGLIIVFGCFFYLMKGPTSRKT